MSGQGHNALAAHQEGIRVKSIRTDPANHAAEGDERIRTAVCDLGYESVYELLAAVIEGRA